MWSCQRPGTDPDCEGRHSTHQGQWNTQWRSSYMRQPLEAWQVVACSQCLCDCLIRPARECPHWHVMAWDRSVSQESITIQPHSASRAMEEGKLEKFQFSTDQLNLLLHSFMQRPVHPSFEWVKPIVDRSKYNWTSKKAAKITYCQLCPEKGVTCVCNLFHVIKHILSGAYVYEFTSTCPPKNVWMAKMCEWQKCGRA